MCCNYGPRAPSIPLSLVTVGSEESANGMVKVEVMVPPPRLIHRACLHSGHDTDARSKHIHFGLTYMRIFTVDRADSQPGILRSRGERKSTVLPGSNFEEGT